MIRPEFFIYLAVMAGVTYLIRMIPLVLIKKKITNKYLISFLHYIPYTVLSAMTVPAIFFTVSPVPAICGFIIAVVLALYDKGLIIVATLSCVGVLVAELVSNLFV